MVAMNVWPTDAADGSVSSEARWRKMGRLWTPTGVSAGVSTALVPTLAFPNLTIKAGACWVDGHYCELLGDQVLAVTPNGLAVVRFDPAANTAQLLYVDGATVPAQNPVGTYEVPIAKIVGSALTDMRPIVSPTSLSFNSTAARDAWPAVNGDIAYVGRTPWLRSAGVWVPLVPGQLVANYNALIPNMVANTLGMRDVLAIFQGVFYPFAVICNLVVGWQVGFGSVAINWTTDYMPFSTTVAVGGGAANPNQSIPGAFSGNCHVGQYSVAPGLDVGFKIRCNVTAMSGGAAHSAGSVSAMWFAA